MTGLEGLKQFWNDSQIIQIPKLTKLELKSYQAENISLEISWRADFQICICIIKDKYRETSCLYWSWVHCFTPFEWIFTSTVYLHPHYF